MDKKIHILLIEDNESDFRLVELYLKEAFPANYLLAPADRLAKATELLNTGTFDVILCDLALPDSYGIETFYKVHAASSGTPVIVLTGYGDDVFGTNAVAQGAADFLNKNQLDANLLKRSIIYSIERNNLHKELLIHTKQVEESEKKYRSLFEDSKDSIYVTSPEGKILDFNKATLELFRYTAEEMKALNIADAYYKPEDREKLLEVMKKNGHIKDYEVTLKRKDGKPILCLITASVRKDEKGNETYHGMIRDITAFRKMDELRRDKEVAEKAARARQEFLSIMSHEIRTPLNAVLGITHLLLEENPLPHQKENLKLLNYSANNLLTLLNNILDYSKVESGKLAMEKISFDFYSLINHVTASFRHNAEEKGLKLFTNYDTNIPQFLIGDPFRLTQVFNNLLHNALKFTRRGSITLRVEMLSHHKEEVELGFEVSDTGIGIETKLLGEIFDSFAQARLSITRQYGGTGLGLYICKQLVELMGGEITAKSQIGKGSTFSFDLEFGVSSEKATTELTESDDTSHSPLESKKILLVEDNDTNRMLAQKFISRWGAAVDTAINGHEAVEKIQKQDYDIVLMDLQMPVMNGYEATQKIRTLGFTKEKLPIVALSAYTTDEDRKRVISSGMNDFIPKPINIKELYRKLIINLGLATSDKETIPAPEAEEGILTIEELLETFPDNDFRIHYLDLLRRDFNDLPLKISESINKNDPKLLSVHIHKISPAFARLDERALPEKLTHLRNLISKEKKDDDTVFALMRDVRNICSGISDRMFELKRKYAQEESNA